MSHIKIYANGYGIDKKYHKVRIHYQFHFYYFLPYVLMSDLKDIHVRAEGLFVQDENFESHSLSRYPDRIYLRSIHNTPIEQANYILNIADYRSHRNDPLDKRQKNQCYGSGCISIDTDLNELSNSLLGNDQEHLNKIRKRKPLKE